MKQISSIQSWQSIASQVKASIIGDCFWESYFNSIEEDCYPYNIHLGIFVEPYLQYVLEGKKTVESRFSVHRIAPYNHVQNNDLLLLKQSGGPIVGLSQVSFVWQYNLNPSSWKEIRKEFTEMLCAQDPNFWAIRRKACYATLMRLNNVKKITPIEYVKRDRRGWVVLQNRDLQLKLKVPESKVVFCFSGGIGSGKSTLSHSLAEVVGWKRVSFGDFVRKKAKEMQLNESRESLQMIGAQLVANGGNFCQQVLNDSQWKKDTNLIIDGIRHLDVLSILKRMVKPFKLYHVHIVADDATRSNRIEKRADEGNKTIYELDKHSTECEVHTILFTKADLIVNGNKPIQVLLDEIFAFLRLKGIQFSKNKSYTTPSQNIILE